MSKIFISYRRSDSPDVTGRIYDHLCRSFRRDQLFKDVDSIPFGEDFRAVITAAVQACDVVVVIIGAGWLGVKTSEGDYRLNDPNDFVRIEIEGALARQIPTIPVLVGGAEMPAPEMLPSSIQPLAFRNAIQVRPDPDFRNDIARLVRALQRATKPGTPIDRIRRAGPFKAASIIAALAVALILISIIGLYFLGAPKVSDQNPATTQNQSGVTNQTLSGEGTERSPSRADTPYDPATPGTLIHNLTVTTNKNYVASNLEEGSKAYTDRDYVYTHIPSFLRGRSYIITVNEDKCPDDPSNFFLEFDVSRPITVYIAHDDRYLKKPSWLADFKKTTERIILTLRGARQSYTLYRKDFSPGPIILRNNIDSSCKEEGNFAMYSVIVAEYGQGAPAP